MFEHSTRIPDIRKIDKKYRLNYIDDYLSYKINPDQSYILLLGDSQFYGYHQSEKYIFSNYLTRNTDKTQLLNLSLNDARPSDVIQELKLIRSHSIKVTAIIYGLNLGHFGDGNGTYIRRLPDHKANILLPLYTTKVTFDYWTEKLFPTQFSQQFTEKALPSSLAHAPEILDSRFPLLLQEIKRTSQKALIISEPRSEIDILRQPENKIVKDLWTDLYANETKEYGLHFIDASAWMDNSCFIENTHLNKKGHELFSQKLLKDLQHLWPDYFLKYPVTSP